MAIKKSIPAVQAAVANTLTLNLAAEITAVNAAWNDSLTLSTSPTIINGYRDPIPEYPAIVVSWVDTDIVLDAATNWQETHHRVEATLICQALEMSTLDAMVQRYLTAMWEVFLKNPGLDGSLSGLIGFAMSKIARSEVYRIKTGVQLMQSAGILGTVMLDESS